MPTRTELRRMIAEEVGIVAAGESLSAEDDSYIKRREDSKLAELYEAGLVSFDIEGTIPQAFMSPLAKVIASEVAPGYGADVNLAKALERDGMATLRRLKAPPYFADSRNTYY